MSDCVCACLARDTCLCVSRKNPLGMGGDMAKRYGDLVCELWKGTSKSIVPLRFRVSVSVRVCLYMPICRGVYNKWILALVTSQKLNCTEKISSGHQMFRFM